MSDSPHSFAFAICATGERYLKYRERLLGQLKLFVPGVDVVDIDLSEAKKCLEGVPEKHIISFARLAIPLMDLFKQYDRVIYLDVDVDIRSGMFAGILDEVTGDSGIAACADVSQGKYHKYLKGHFPQWNATTYYNSGMVVFDLFKINREAWHNTLRTAIDYHSKNPLRWRDQDVINAYFDVREIGIKYNYLWCRGNIDKSGAYLVHYCNKHGRATLDKIISDEAATNMKQVDAYVKVALHHNNIVNWFRSYFASGNSIPVVAIRDPYEDWQTGDVEYCQAAVSLVNGRLTNEQEVQQVAQSAKIADVPDDIDIVGDLGQCVGLSQDKVPNSVYKQRSRGDDGFPPAPFESMLKIIPAPRASDDEAVDAVFVIGTGSQNNNEELRYALRNVAKHCPFVRDVYISGECPAWVDKSVVKHLQWPDRFRHAKDANIIDKLRHACETKGIAKRILFCSDDQFQTHVCKWEDYFPRYLRRYDPESTWYEDRKRTWHIRLKNTLERDRQRRIAAGLDTSHIYYYEPHMWMQIDRDKFIEYAKWSDYAHRADTIVASGYFNFIDAGGHPHDDGFDHKFIGEGEKQLPKVTHIAYTDGGYKQAMVFLKELFPTPCRFELSAEANADNAAAFKVTKAPQAPQAAQPPVIFRKAEQQPVFALRAPNASVKPKSVAVPRAAAFDREKFKSAFRARIGKMLANRHSARRSNGV